MSTARKHVVRFALLCGVIAAVAPAAAKATSAGPAAVPCWKLLLNDWYDGTINKIYAIPCYSAAIKHLPPDLRIYGSAKDDILAARAAAEQKHAAPPEKGHPTTTAASTTKAASTTTTTTTTTGSNGTTTTTVVVVPVTTPPKKSGGVSHLLNQLTPGNPDSFPLPLLILGALAIALVLAGALGMLWQRSHPPDDGATEA
jgi:hypothetical protein